MIGGEIFSSNAELAKLHRNVLDQVFGLTEGAPPERFLVGIAALDLVATAAKKQPVVWLIRLDRGPSGPVHP